MLLVRTPSSTADLYEYRFFLSDGATWENLLMFSVSNASISSSQSVIKTLKINGDQFNINKLADWNSDSKTFTYLLVFELWLYNVTSNSVQFNNRFVDLQLNLTNTI